MTRYNTTQVDGAYALATSVLRDGGGTFAPWSYRKADHTKGYYVALGGYEQTYPLTGCETKDHAMIRREAELFANTWFGYGRAGWRRFIGTWVFDGTFYLDITEHVDSETEAITKARFGSQLAIWDIVANQEIPVGNMEVYE
jgi:hypothetical protein